MLTIRYLDKDINVTAYCNAYAASEDKVLYYVSIAGTDSSVRAVAAAVQTGDNVILSDNKKYIGTFHAEKLTMKRYSGKLEYNNASHFVLIHKAADSDQYGFDLLLDNTPEALFAVLKERYTVPMISEWQEEIWRVFSDAGYIQALEGRNTNTATLIVSEQDVERVVVEGVRSGRLIFPPQTVEMDGCSIDKVESVETYLNTFAPELAEKINQQFKPLHIPEEGKWDSRLRFLKREPFEAQAHVIMGAVKALKETSSVNVVGEMGTGKSFIGASIPYVASHKPCRAVIVCPGHLVRKWQREIEKTIPSSKGIIIRSFKDLLQFRNAGKADAYEYYIISKDRAKLGYCWESAVVSKRKLYRSDGETLVYNACLCPVCGDEQTDDDGIPIPRSSFARKKRSCAGCKSMLWQADSSRIRRFSPAEFIKKYFKGFFDYAIFDEVHELKGGSTAQGNVMGMLASVAGKTITLTGTLMGGYADDIFYLLYRTTPGLMQAEGFQWGETQKWLENFGVLERVTKVRLDGSDNAMSRGSKRNESVRRKPGISPLVYSKFLLGNSVFVQLEDMSEELPDLIEEVVPVDMSQELEQAYNCVSAALEDRVRKDLAACGNSKLLGTYLMSTLAYPDKPFDFGPIIHPDAKARMGDDFFILPASEQMKRVKQLLLEKKLSPSDVVTMPPDLPEQQRYPKEKAMLDIVRSEVSEGRRCFIFCTFTGKRDITPRIEDVLSSEGIQAVTLKSTVAPERREAWVEDRVKEGCKVIIANPELVKTGLDLLSFPTIVFDQTGYSTFTLRQASRRSWRIGQDRDVKVFYLFYRKTMQEKALSLMGSKLEASMGVEGRFSEDGLITMSSGDDIMTALARSLEGKLNDVDSAEDIWTRMKSKAPQKKTAPVEEKPVQRATERNVRVQIIERSGRRKFTRVVEVNTDYMEQELEGVTGDVQLMLF